VTGDLEGQWPLFGLQMKMGDVSLSPVREVDLPALARMLPADAEQDPTSSMLDGLSIDENRRRILAQSYWRSWASWTVESWYIFFRVTAGGRMVGIQTLEAEHFPALRTVDSSSWLVADARGKGIGVAMRTAMLALAFDHLGADAAVTSAREDNLASIGVSRHLGYQDNGTSKSLSPSGPCVLLHMILHRDSWLSSPQGTTVEVRGLDACAPWFGVEIVP
jgi:RimJ/RimL family protein N-acetyltransferase